ncbi:MAG: ATP synthase F1 subunit epsilon [Mariniblastus sp.]|nr:ATP synthase F1 subunit epsilon [Mariniblastus sp.]
MSLQIVVVTPERTTLDQQVDSVIVPSFDGERGIYNGHAPLVERLGPGELRTVSGDQVSRYYVDGGFVQVSADVVSVLTGRSIPAGEIDLSAAKQDLETAEREPANNTELMELKQKAIAQAKAQIRMAENNP